MKKLFDEITAWQAETFGENRNARGPARHLLKEAHELWEKPTDITELADVLFLAFDVARCNGYSFEFIRCALETKLMINRERKWQKPDADGVCEHVRDE